MESVSDAIDTAFEYRIHVVGALANSQEAGLVHEGARRVRALRVRPLGSTNRDLARRIHHVVGVVDFKRRFDQREVDVWTLQQHLECRNLRSAVVRLLLGRRALRF